MKRLTLIAVLAAASACSPRGADPEAATWTMAGVAGSYGQSGHIGFLELDANGTYECFVINGITADGCGTFEGAGISEGSWVFEGGSVSFFPMTEPPDLVVKLSGASAVPSDNGLVLTIEGTDHLLARSATQAEQPNKAMQTDGPPGRR